MRDTSMMGLLSYLYDQLDALATLDYADEGKVAAACAVNKAVNDTTKSITSLVDLSLRAYDARPGTVSAQTVRGFFGEGGA